MEDIVRRYVALATEAADNNDIPQARRYLERAALVAPHSRLLKQAQDRLADGDTTQPLADAVAKQAGRITDKKTRRKLNEARKALSKQDYGKALELLRGTARKRQ